MPEPLLVGTYGNSVNSGTSTVSVPNVQVGDVLAVVVSTTRFNGTITVGGNGAGTYVPVGLQRGDNANFEWCTMMSWYKRATATGTYTVTCAVGTSSKSVGVLHLRRVHDTEGNPRQTATSQGSVDAICSMVGVDTYRRGSLQVMSAALAMDSGAVGTWKMLHDLPVDVIKRVDVTSPNGTNTLAIFTRVLPEPDDFWTVNYAQYSRTSGGIGEGGRGMGFSGAGAAAGLLLPS